MTVKPLLLRRFGAMLYDLLVLAALWMLVAALALVLVHGQVDVAHPPTAWQWSLRVAIVVATALYFVLSWHRGGQTIGMRAWRLRVHGMDGHRPSMPCAVLRFVLASLSLLLLGAGFWWAWFDPQGRTAHDRLCNTVVLRITS